MTINDRLKELRTHLGLTQSDFGEKIGLKKSALSRMEKDVSVNARVIQLICSSFNVNEEWLVNGTGDMFTNAEDQLLANMAKTYNMSEEEVIFARHWLSQPDGVRTAVIDFALELAHKIENYHQQTAQSAAKMQHSDSRQANSAAPLQQAPHGRVSESDTSPAITSSAAQLANRYARPAGISDQEWELLQEMRREKGTSSASASTSSEKRA